MKLTLPLLLLLLIAPAARAEDDARSRFWEARRVMLKGDPASAAELFRVLQAAHPKDDVADDCLYWMGRCYLRQDDHEPDAVVALSRLVKEYPKSPFTEEAARELARLGDRSLIPVLKERLAKDKDVAEPAARALAEFGEETGIKWLADETGEKPPVPVTAPTRKRDELAELRDQVRRLRSEVDEALALLRKLLAERKSENDD